MAESQVNASTAGTDAAESAEAEQGGLERKMETRHLTMISLGGVIGTGLFLSSGYTIHQAGPLGAIIAYGIGSMLVYFVMLSLGELSVAMPYAGSFHLYAKRFIGPGTAFTIAVLYWLNWAVALASEFTAAGLLMQRWFPHSPAWVWSAAFIVVVFLLNILSVRLYGESEFWFASIKVFAIIAFIIIGLLAMFGAIPIAGYDHEQLVNAAHIMLAAQKLDRLAAFLVVVSSGTLLTAFGFTGTLLTGPAIYYLISSVLTTGAFFMLAELIERTRSFGANVLAPILMGFDPNLAVLMSGIGTLIFFLITGGKVPSYLEIGRAHV